MNHLAPDPEVARLLAPLYSGAGTVAINIGINDRVYDCVIPVRPATIHWRGASVATGDTTALSASIRELTLAIGGATIPAETTPRIRPRAGRRATRKAQRQARKRRR